MSKTAMGPPTRFMSGVVDVMPDKALANYRRLDPSKWHEFFDDFDSSSSTTIYSAVGQGTPAISDVAGRFGLITIVSTALGVDTAFIRAKQLSFNPRTDWDLFFKARLKISALTATIVAGLTSGATPEAPDRGIFFRSVVTTGALQLVAKDASGETSQDLDVSLVADTEIVLAFHLDRTGVIRAYVDEDVKGSVAANVPVDNDMAPTLGHANATTAAAHTTTADYLMASEARWR